MLTRNFLDMDGLLAKWESLGDKRLPKTAIIKKVKARGGGTRKGPTIDEQILRTEQALRLKQEDVVDEDFPFVVMSPAPPRLASLTPEEENPDELGVHFCVYCEAALPENPSELLLGMLEAAERQTPTASIIAPLCAQHELEDLLLPMAIRNGWPQELDLPNIEHRLKAKKAFFEAFINNEEGIRDGNIFWMNAIAQLARPHGGALGGTFTTFHLTQPGYYGEQGTRKIHDTFYRLLQISPESADPLTPLQLMDLVLIPEAGVQLILDDFGNGMERATAIATMYESGKYGAQMFPAE